MANIKITDLGVIADPISSDVLPIVDVSADTTNKISIEQLLKNAAAGTAAAPAFAFDDDPDTGIYRTGANGLGFSTGGTGRLFIDSSGRVGIGTSAPSEELEVVGDIKFGSGSNTWLSSTNVLKSSNSQGAFLRAFVSTAANPTYAQVGDENTGVFFPGADALGVTTGGIERLRIDSSGRVGIGSSAPGQNLEVGDASTPKIRFQRTGSFYWDIGHTSSDFQFESQGNGVILHMNFDGNVGVGTTNPLYPLDVKSTSGDAWMRLDSAGSTSNSGYRFAHAGTNHFVIYHDGSNDSLAFYNNVTATQPLTLTNAGRLGVGTSSPSARLHVSGGDSVFGSTNLFRIFSTGQTVDFVNAAQTAYVSGRVNGHDLKFYTNTGAGIDIDSSGRVGIKTSAPSYALDISSTDANALRIRGTADNPLIMDATDSGPSYVSVQRAGTRVAYYGFGGSANLFQIVNEASGGAITLSTSSTERFRIDSSGRLGVGISSPDTTLKLHVGGNIGFDNNNGIYGKNSAGTAMRRLLHIGGDNNLYINANPENNAVVIQSGVSTEALRIDSSGRLGVGTSSPTHTLEVENATPSNDGGIRVSNVLFANNQNKPFLIAGTSAWTGANTNWNTYGWQFKIKSDSSGVGRMSIDVANNSTDTEAFQVFTDGKVNVPGRLGINYSTPYQAFVARGVSGESSIGSFVSVSANCFVGLNASGTTQSPQIGASNDHLLFRTGYTERMRIESDGKVGIGTTAPNLNLDVHNTGSEDTTIRIYNSGTGSSADTIWRGQIGGTTASNYIYFGDADDADVGRIRYLHSNNAMYFRTNNSDALTITGSQKVGIGTSAPSGLLDVNDATGSLSTTKDITAEFHRADGTYHPRLQIRHSTAGTDLNHTWGTSASSLTFSIGGNEKVKIDSNGTLTAGDDNATSGQTIIDGWYSGDNRLNVLGSQYSSGGTVLCFACKPKNDAAGYVSAAGNASFRKVAIELAESGRSVTFKHAAAATVAIDSDVTLSRIAAFTPDGLCFGDDTAAANALDDYEEGTWTPVIVGGTTAGTGTYTVQSGKYTRIGQFVHYEFRIDVTAHTGSGTMDISGLPFTVDSVSVTPGSAWCSNLSVGTNYYFAGTGAMNNTTKIRLYRSEINLSNVATISLDSSCAIYGSGSYRV